MDKEEHINRIAGLNTKIMLRSFHNEDCNEWARYFLEEEKEELLQRVGKLVQDIKSDPKVVLERIHQLLTRAILTKAHEDAERRFERFGPEND